MFMKKGKEWALSCVAVSAAVLVGVSATTVHADATTDNGTAITSGTAESSNPEQGNESNNVTAAASTNSANENDQEDQENQQEQQEEQEGQEQQEQQQEQENQQENQQGNQQAAPDSLNTAVPDGGHVSQDFNNEGSNQLGYASNFHIFANEATLNTHTNGNVAVGDFYGNVNFGTNVHEGIIDKEISYIQSPHNIASSSFVTSGDTRDNKVVFGSGNDIDISGDNPIINNTKLDHLSISDGEIYQDKNSMYIDVENYLNRFLSQKSINLTNSDPQAKINNSEFPDQNQRVINLEDYQRTADNHIVIDLDADVLTSGTPLTIYGMSQDSGGTGIIINVDTKGQDPYTINSQIKLIYNNGTSNNDVERPNKETEFFDDNHLLWNFYDSTASDKLYAGQINIDRPFQGSVLAPKGTVVVNANLDGNIAANKVVVNAETHRWDLQDKDDEVTEFERPVVIPGEAEIPSIDEEENNGGNIEYPDEEEEEDIDPDTGDLIEVDGGSEGENPDEEENGNEDEDGNTDEDADANEEELENEGNILIHGGSEGTNPDLEGGVLSEAVGNDKDESQTPGNGGSLPQTSEASGVVTSILGLILLAFSSLMKAIHVKKED